MTSVADMATLISNGSLRIGATEKLADLKKRFPKTPTDEEDERELRRQWGEFVKETRIRVGTILKAQRLSVLLGAGASKDAGGPLLGTIPLDVESELAAEGLTEDGLKPWLETVYLAAARVSSDQVPTTTDGVKERLGDSTRKPLTANYERVLFVLHVWEQALADGSATLTRLTNEDQSVNEQAVVDARRQLTRALIKRCDLPAGSGTDSLRVHRGLVRRLLTRPTNLQRVGLFTLNYDTLIEQAADAEGAVLVDGFVGNVSRVFRPDSYDYDLYFPAETTEGPIHRLDRVLQLYKLHGSINWRSVEPSWINPFGIETQLGAVDDANAAVIYPTPAKHGDALAMPYAELFRRLAAAIVRPQSVLIVIGYAFPDEHLNAIVRQALAVPSFTLVIVDPEPRSPFVKQLAELDDQRLWIFSGALGTFEQFVATALPDLRESEVEREVAETYRAIRIQGEEQPE